MFKFKNGDLVYFEKYGNTYKGVIESTIYFSELNKKGYKIITSYGSFVAFEEHCFSSLEEMAINNHKIIEKYVKEIKTIEDLVVFLFNHDVVSEYKDFEAREAVKIAALKFGVKLE